MPKCAAFMKAPQQNTPPKREELIKRQLCHFSFAFGWLGYLLRIQKSRIMSEPVLMKRSMKPSYSGVKWQPYFSSYKLFFLTFLFEWLGRVQPTDSCIQLYPRNICYRLVFWGGVGGSLLIVALYSKRSSRRTQLSLNHSHTHTHARGSTRIATSTQLWWSSTKCCQSSDWLCWSHTINVKIHLENSCCAHDAYWPYHNDLLLSNLNRLVLSIVVSS